MNGPRPRPRLARSAVWLAGAAAAVAVVAGVLSWWWVPNYRPALREGEVHGIDVSHHQGEIDWPAVAADGISFAYIKATEGGDHIDRRFAENWAGARAAGLRVGAYHFFTLCRPGAEQADNLLSTMPAGEADLPVAVDFEYPGNCAARPPVAELHREADAFLERVEAATGRPVIVYSIDGLERRYRMRRHLDRGLWERRLYVRRRADGGSCGRRTSGRASTASTVAWTST